ncbi:hypothetical protein SAMN05421842_11579 [Clostridium uliginosum]|uniref:Uncharacterized protein n=1 Tax=Clostridium uliginosum TaxID=119641 RepID=A0A1I1NJ60_9CLOT|nr:hypothetical protein SAMN05421842_11579 [Clostridium uliginosum]
MSNFDEYLKKQIQNEKLYKECETIELDRVKNKK